MSGPGHPINIRRIDHVVLRARDPAALVSFYQETLGCALEKTQAGLGLYQLRAGSSLIDVVDVAGELGANYPRAPARDAPNVDHFCVQVEPWDAAAIRAHLAAHGVAAGEVVRRYGARGYGPSIYLTDPEGNVVELKGPPGSG